MNFEAAANTDELVGFFRKFIALTGWQPWKARLRSFEQQIKQNPLIEQYILEQYGLELELGRLQKQIQQGRLRARLPDTSDGIGLAGLIAMTVRVHEELSDQGKKRLEGMIRSGLKNRDGLSSLRHELNIAAHLMSRGFDVEFSDIETGSGFDLLATKGAIEIEVECKNFSADVGRKVHRHRMFQLGGFLYPHMKRIPMQRGVMHVARIRLPQRLEGDEHHMRAIARAFGESVANGQSIDEAGLYKIEYESISMAERSLDGLRAFRGDTEALRTIMEEDFGIPIGHAMFLVRPGRGLIIVTVQSEMPDRVMDALVKQMKETVKRQISRSRPANLCVRFADLTEDELVSIAEADRAGDNSALQVATSGLFRREDWKSVHSVAYIVPGHTVRGDGHIQEQGKTYVFSNPANESAGDDRFQIFFKTTPT